MTAASGPARGGVAALERIRVVLCQTTHPGNIGAAARAMKTMNLGRLYLVEPRHFPDPQADALASGADDVLANATVCGSLDEALAGTTLAIAMSARRRDLSQLALAVRDAALLAVDEAPGGEVAFVFGTEISGLSNEEAMKCQRIAHIPAAAGYSSLNLAASVQVVAYELRVAAIDSRVDDRRLDPATFEEVEKLMEHLERSAIESGFLDPANPRRLMERLRRLFGRARLEREEVNILRGMLAAWDERGRRK